MTHRKTWNHKHKPMSVYEAHIGSWMRHPGTGKMKVSIHIESLPEQLPNILKEMGYTHVE
mgnify:CR=1 FL=1